MILIQFDSKVTGWFKIWNQLHLLSYHKPRSLFNVKLQLLRHCNWDLFYVYDFMFNFWNCRVLEYPLRHSNGFTILKLPDSGSPRQQSSTTISLLLNACLNRLSTNSDSRVIGWVDWGVTDTNSFQWLGPGTRFRHVVVHYNNCCLFPAQCCVLEVDFQCVRCYLGGLGWLGRPWLDCTARLSDW